MCKTCNKCGVTYEDVNSNFYRINKSIDIFHGICKLCKKKYDQSRAHIRREKAKLWPSQSKERRREKRKKASQQAKINAYNRTKQYWKDNKEKCRAAIQKWKKNNQDKVKEHDRKVSQRILTTLPDNYVIRLIRLSLKNKNYIPQKEEINIYKELILLRREKLQFINQVKTLNIKI
jgi:hypothetical protein